MTLSMTKSEIKSVVLHPVCNVMIFLPHSSKQRDLYDETFRDLVQAVVDGFNGTIFAYGQTVS